MSSTKYLIIGGGLAAASAVKQLVQADESAKGATVIISAEAEPPYHRPPLSKGFLRGEEARDDILVEPEAFYKENGIDIRYRTRARLIDPASRVCELELNRSIKFEKALIATGASPVRHEGQGRALEGIHYLRNINDSKRIAAAAQDMNEAVVVGGGFIAMEVASVLAAKKIRTTILTRTQEPFDKLYNPEVSSFFRQYFERRHIHFVTGDEVYGLFGAGQVSSVHTKKGRKIAADGVVFGIGVKPNTAIAEASRMAVDNGIVVDSTLQTSVPGIYAAGDVASFYDNVFGVQRRIEHWDNAMQQGETAGRNLAGADEEYSRVSMFFCDLFDLSFEVYGMPSSEDRVIQRGSVSDRSIFSLYIKDGIINAALLMGRSEEETETVSELIRRRISATGRESILKNEKRDLQELLD